MKKYLFGMLAVVFAVGFSAFTKAPQFVNKVYELNMVPATEDDLEDLSNWNEVTPGIECDDVDQVACRINVDPDDFVVDVLNPSIKHPTKVNIVGDTFTALGTDTYFVASIASTDITSDAAGKTNNER